MPNLDPLPILVRDSRFREHALPGGHPECPERLDAIDAALARRAAGLHQIQPRAASDDEILRVHTRSHLQTLVDVEGEQTRLDPDTYSAPRSLEIARLAAGSLIDISLRVARGEAPSGFAAIRPPGHHAESAHAMGFCLLNNVALAVRALQAELGIERVAILDWDVHHGNGTQHIFEDERDVLFASLHQFPFYPGTGALGERGNGEGLGSSVNLPLPAGCGDAEYGAVFDEVALPILRQFAPQILVVSAGFDAHARDPLGSMQVSTLGFRRFAERARSLADDVCGGRLVIALEGGYDLQALGESVAEVIDTLCAESVADGKFPPASPIGMQVVREFRQAHAENWSDLRDSTWSGSPDPKI